MKIINSPLLGAAEIISTAHTDQRGWFSRYFCINELSPLNNDRKIVQINSSFTIMQGTVRGLHYQRAPFEEDKIVRCLNGKVFDVMLDIRVDSVTFGLWHSVVLDSEKMNMVYIPKGFAHGFQTLEPNCQILYLHTQFHNPETEDGYHYLSPKLNIRWPLKVSEISIRDKNLPLFSN